MVPLRPIVPPSIGALCISGIRLTSTRFYSQVLWGLLFLALMPRVGEPDVGLGPHISQGGPLHLRYHSQSLFSTPGMWDLPVLPLSPFCGPDVALFLYP